MPIVTVQKLPRITTIYCFIFAGHSILCASESRQRIGEQLRIDPRGWVLANPVLQARPHASDPALLVQTMADFAYLPFGGGSRKCVGDQFAVMESVVGLAMLLRRYDIQLAGKPEDVQMQTGATIHTKDGLWCQLKRRKAGAAGKTEEKATVTVS